MNIAEAEYADRKKKDMIIPVRVQPGYKSSGWLDLMLGGLLYIDFTKPDCFEEAYNQLCAQIAAKGKLYVGFKIIFGTENVQSYHSRVLFGHVKISAKVICKNSSWQS